MMIREVKRLNFRVPSIYNVIWPSICRYYVIREHLIKSIQSDVNPWYCLAIECEQLYYIIIFLRAYGICICIFAFIWYWNVFLSFLAENVLPFSDLCIAEILHMLCYCWWNVFHIHVLFFSLGSQVFWLFEFSYHNIKESKSWVFAMALENLAFQTDILSTQNLHLHLKVLF